jgi:hypothetical protein
MIRNRIVVDLAERAFLGADTAGEITEMVDGQRQIRRRGFPDWLAVVPGLDESELVEIVFHNLRDAHQDLGTLAGAGAAPGVLRGMRSVEREFDVVLVGPGDFTNDPTID